MPDPGSEGGGQISLLILDDGKSPKGLVCHLRRADILQMFLFGCLSGAMEIRLAPNKTFSPVTPPSPLSLLLFPPITPPQVRNATSRSELSLSPQYLSHYLESLAAFLFGPALLYVIAQCEL